MKSEQVSKWDELRKRAEGVLSTGLSPAAGCGERDILRTLHELEVHQVELEIQGEELRAKNIELQELMRRYADFYHRAPVGLVSLSARGAILEANDAASEMFGLKASSLVRRAFSRLVHVADHEKYFEILRELNRVPGGNARGRLRLLRHSALPFCAHLEIVLLKNDRREVQGRLAAFVDISRIKTAERDQNQHGHRTKFQIFAGFARHENTSPLCKNCTRCSGRGQDAVLAWGRGFAPVRRGRAPLPHGPR